MSEIEKILEQNMEEYESARRRAKKLVKGYTQEISRNYEYADALVNLPVNPKQIFFLWEKTINPTRNITIMQSTMLIHPPMVAGTGAS